MSKDGALFHWRYTSRAALTQDSSDEEEDVDMELDENKRKDRVQWRIASKHFFMQTGSKVRSCQFFAPSNLMVVGFSNGIFGLYELPGFTNIHTLR